MQCKYNSKVSLQLLEEIETNLTVRTWTRFQVTLIKNSLIIKQT